MVARIELRRRAFFDGAFGGVRTITWPSPTGVRRAVARAMTIPRPDGFDRLVKLFDGDDDVFVVPDAVAATRDARRDLTDAGHPLGRILERTGFRVRAVDDNPDRPVVVVRLESTRAGLDDIDAAAAVLWLVDADDGERLRPVYGFLANQTTQPCEDVESGPETLESPTGEQGAGVRVAILDTGCAATAWTPLPAGVSFEDIDVLDALIPAAQGGRYLGRAAGHGAFMAGIVEQCAPSATVTVTRVADTEGFVDELRLVRKIDELTALPFEERPDVVVLAVGGYGVHWGVFGQPGNPAPSSPTWLDPRLLVQSLGDLLRAAPGAVVVCSAGNYGSTAPCYPAALADPRHAPWPDDDLSARIISVAALDACGRRAGFSNYGPWVKASAIGVRLHSAYVAGMEHPDNDPDGTPETFGTDSIAEWSGTSFAAPVVAGELAAALAADRATSSTATAASAWVDMSKSTAFDPGCGDVVNSTRIAHG